MTDQTPEATAQDDQQRAAIKAAEKEAELARRRAALAQANGQPADPTAAGMAAAAPPGAAAPPAADGPPRPRPSRRGVPVEAPAPAAERVAAAPAGPGLTAKPCAGCQQRYESLEAQVALVDRRVMALGRVLIGLAVAVVVSQFIKDRADARAAAAADTAE